jgi:hypothetical protein
MSVHQSIIVSEWNNSSAFESVFMKWVLKICPKIRRSLKSVKYYKFFTRISVLICDNTYNTQLKIKYELLLKNNQRIIFLNWIVYNIGIKCFNDLEAWDYNVAWRIGISYWIMENRDKHSDHCIVHCITLRKNIHSNTPQFYIIINLIEIFN